MTKTIGLAGRALRSWGGRQWGVALVAALGTALLIGVATVLVPNGMFRRDVAPVPWNYPVWIISAALTGILIGTYATTPGADATASAGGAASVPSTPERGKLGWLGTALAWFAVGCPVCNKLALLALGYSGALTYFAPVQPYLAAVAVALLLIAVVQRLAGQIACPVRTQSADRSPGR